MAKFRVPVIVEVELDLDDLDGMDAAVTLVDETLQRAWDTDRGRHHVQGWHFEIDPEGETVMVDEPASAAPPATGPVV